MEKRFYYQVIKGHSLIGEPHVLLRDAVLAAASYDGHAAKFIRDKHGLMCFFASRQPMINVEYIPAPCDGFRPWSPLKDDDEAEEHVAKLILESGWLHFKHKDMDVVTLTYENDVLTELSNNAPEILTAMLNN